jgi:ABC-type branched-subunit amino acid transport system permease subunit
MPARLAGPATIFPGLLTVVACAVYGILFLHAESQAAVLGLIAAAGAAAWGLARVDWPERARASFSAHPRTLPGLVVLGVAAVLVVFRGEHFPLLMLASTLLYTTACLGLTVQFGYAGVVNFAGAAFFGIGAYTAAVLVGHTAVPHLVVMILGGLVSALLGSLLIFPVLRTRGHYAALVTIAFGILFRQFVEVNDALGGPQGLQVKGLNLFGWDLNTPIAVGGSELSFYANYVVFALALAAVAFVAVRRLERSWAGLNLDAVRLDETVCAVFGIEVGRWKIVAFTFGNFLAGTAGAVYAQMAGFVAPNSFTFGDSLILVSIVLLGGLGNAWGVALAAVIVIVLPEKLQALQEYRFLLYAVLVIAILLFRPAGLLPRRTREYLPGWRAQ